MSTKATKKTTVPVKVTVETVTVNGVRTFKFPVERTDPKTGKVQFKCGSCGKWIFKEEAILRGEGDYCNCVHEAMGYTDAALVEHRKQWSKTEVPTGWIKVATLHLICNKNKIPVSKMLACMGWDRGLYEPVDERFRPWHIGNARWLDPFCSSPEGLKMMRECNRKKPAVTVTEPTAPVVKLTVKKGKKAAPKKAAVQEPEIVANEMADELMA